MSNETKQTAVEWLQIQLKKGIGFNPLDPLSYPKAVNDIFKQAKEMEKQQIIEDFVGYDSDTEDNLEVAEQYYNETYGGNK